MKKKGKIEEVKKINNQYLLRNVAGERIVVPTGSAVQKFNGLITLNEVAALIWECLQKQMLPEEIVQKILQEYDVEEAEAVRDVNGFMQMLTEQGILLEEK